MTIQEVLDRMDGFSDDERGQWIGALIGVLSPISKQTLSNEQSAMVSKSDGDFGVFCNLQNEVIRQCVVLECSSIGQIIRKEFGLEPLVLSMPLGG
jgi:hypothetical protein